MHQNIDSFFKYKIGDIVEIYLYAVINPSRILASFASSGLVPSDSRIKGDGTPFKENRQNIPKLIVEAEVLEIIRNGELKLLVPKSTGWKSLNCDSFKLLQHDTWCCHEKDIIRKVR